MALAGRVLALPTFLHMSPWLLYIFSHFCLTPISPMFTTPDSKKPYSSHLGVYFCSALGTDPDELEPQEGEARLTLNPMYLFLPYNQVVVRVTN